MTHTFLSDEWLREAARLRSEADEPFTTDVLLNVTVTDGPAGVQEFHFDAGQLLPGLVDAPASLTMPFAVARKLFVDGDQGAAVRAFASGQIKVDGDTGELMKLQESAVADGPQARSLVKKLTALTSS